MQPEDVEPKTLLDTSVDRRNYGILIWGSGNLCDLTQIWDLGLGKFSRTYFQIYALVNYWCVSALLIYAVWVKIKQPYLNPR